MPPPPARSRRLRPCLAALDFDEAETDALILGLCVSALSEDPDVAEPAERMLARIDAALPSDPLEIDVSTGRTPVAPPDPTHVELMTRAIRNEHRLALSYVDRSGRATSRTICPLAFAEWGAADTVAAWCELRRDFRHFRLDRIREVATIDGRFWRRRRILVAAWRVSETERDW